MIGYRGEMEVIEIIRKDWRAVIDDLAEVGADSIMEEIADEIAHYNAGEMQTVHLTKREWWEMVGALAVHHNIFVG